MRRLPELWYLAYRKPWSQASLAAEHPADFVVQAVYFQA